MKTDIDLIVIIKMANGSIRNGGIYFDKKMRVEGQTYWIAWRYTLAEDLR